LSLKSAVTGVCMTEEEEKAFDRDLRLASFFWDEFTYRNSLYWGIFYKAVIAHTFFMSIPLLATTQPRSLWIVSVFCIVALLIAGMSAILLFAEGRRLSGPANAYRELVLKYTAADLQTKYRITPQQTTSSGGPPRPKVTTFALTNLASRLPYIWACYGVSSPALVILAILIFDLKLKYG
jgi:hypothetical protein